MAANREDETIRLRNVALLQTLRYIDANLGSWTEKAEQDTALLHVIRTQDLHRKLTRGERNLAPHDVGSLRNLITRAVNAKQKPPRAGGAKKTTKDLFESGSNLFTDNFLADIGFDNVKQPQMMQEAQASNGPIQGSREGDIEIEDEQRSPIGKRPSREQGQDGIEKMELKRKRRSSAEEVEESDTEEPVATLGSEDEPPRKKMRASADADEAGQVKDVGSRIREGNVSQPTDQNPNAISDVSTLERRAETESEVAEDLSAEVEDPLSMHANAPRKRQYQKAFGSDEQSAEDTHNEERHRKRSRTAHDVAAQTQASTTFSRSRDELANVIDLSSEQRPADHSRTLQVMTTGVTSQQPLSILSSANADPMQLNLQPPGTAAPSNDKPSGGETAQAATDALSDDRDREESHRGGASSHAAELHFPDTNVYGAPKPVFDVRKMLERTREIAPEFQPENRARMNMAPCDVKIRDTMKQIERRIGECSQSWCETRGRDPNATPIFLAEPTQDLEELYSRLLSTDTWQLKLIELQSRQDTVVLRARKAVSGLLAAAVTKEVFEKATPWDAERKFDDALSEETKYFEETMKQRGYPWRDSLKHAAWIQAEDKDFQQRVMKPYADKLAHKTMRTMLPHLNSMTHDPKPSQELSFEPEWMRDLEVAFLQALVLKSKLDAACDATFEYYWLEPDSPYVPGDMQPTSQNGRPESVIHALMPGVRFM
ncbi:hypothetical protein LTR56_015839 [Elasticomyces elasticus]|nr:hypothetical protein LTR22_023038 [Elasticomyces elasticus]KAK3633424.1 hypothetical protein LTR56_015839 [Elasticomyces elasticus]KAK4922045.1 hypothetical protein LTR49_010631 [Elasticomyces elasticus]KAK5747803.1 hypothetical protein LTS12_022158 [Elasticomyces elasticus]